MDYLHEYNEIIKQLTGKKPKTNDLYDKIYTIAGLISQLGDLKSLAYFLKKNGKLSYEEYEKMGKIKKLDPETNKVIVLDGMRKYYKNVRIDFKKHLPFEQKTALERVFKMRYLEDVE